MADEHHHHPHGAEGGCCSGKKNKVAVAGATDTVVRDPVCGMTVDADNARHLAEHDGTIFAFCSLGCRTRFIKDPTAYLSPSSISS